jgi:hypothetical protein
VSTQLWASYLAHTGLAPQLSKLVWDARDDLHYSSIVDPANELRRFVLQNAGPGFDAGRVTRVVMVGRSSTAISAFVAMHEAEAQSRAVNPLLRLPTPSDAASLAGLARLQQAFVDVAPPGGEAPQARIVLVWHGTAAEHVGSVCRDGPRSLRKTDSGFFGSGSYFALEAAYASRYCAPDALTGEHAVILFAVSVSQVRVVTPARDYRLHEDPATPQLHGFSNFCSRRSAPAVAIADRCDAHFIPVKYYGHVHPRTGLPTPRDVDYQAVDEGSGQAEGHELVIHSHQRCVPLAVVFFR